MRAETERPAFAARLEDHAGAALILAERSVGYRELASLADAFAARLDPGVRLLAIETAAAVEPIAAYLGALRAGVPVALLGANAAAGAALRDCPPDAVYRFDGAWTLTQHALAWADDPSPELALLLSTSGSTGSGKLVRLSAANLEANARSIAAYLELTSQERAITSLPLSYSYGLSVLNSHLAAGAAIVLTEAGVAEPDFLTALRRHGVTSIAGVPYSYELMDRSGVLDALPPTVKTLTQAGGRMDEALIRRVHAMAEADGRRLFIMYGQTEATARIAYVPPAELAEHVGCIGRAIPGGELWIEDDGHRLPAGAEGELVYCGPNVMMGYAATRAELAAPVQGDVLRTGDLGVEVKPGFFRITGRKSRFVKLFGLRVSLDELESRLREAGVSGVATGDDTLVVLAVPDAAAVATTQALIGELELPGEAMEVLASPEIPRLSGGKVDYQAILRAGREAREARARSRTPFDAVEDRFRRLAGPKGLKPEDTFQSLGGDSLSYVQMSIELEAALGHLPEGWETMTRGQLKKLARTGMGSWRLMRVETDVVLRALAILAVVAFHAGVAPPGGAFVLMLLAGFTWARFQRPRMLAGRPVDAFRDYALRFLPPYIAVILAYFAVRGVFWPGHLLFINTFFHGKAELLQIYWFMESLTWCVGAICVSHLSPAVRAFSRERPAASGLALVAVGVASAVAAQFVFDAETLGRTPAHILVFFAVGWAFVLTSSKALRLGLVAVAVAMGLYRQEPNTSAALAGAGIVLTFLPQISLPRPLGRAVMQISAASFFIYLLHPIAIYVRDQVLHADASVVWPFEIAAGVALGLAGSALLARIDLSRMELGLRRRASGELS